MTSDDDPSQRGGRRRVLLGQLISNGDCLYATTVARQIKHDDPNCHLTWAISERSKAVLDGNPHVDALWVWPAFHNNDLVEAWHAFTQQAEARRASGKFDDLILTQFVAGNVSRWDGTLRSAIFRGYPRPITVPIEPVVRLSQQERENVRQFAQRHGLLKANDVKAPDLPVVLFECAPASGQSFVTPDFALQVARRLLAQFPDLRVILSSHLSVDIDDPHILDGSTLTFRENAELSHYCTLLVGCSSGLTWLCTSDAAQKLPTVQLLTNHTINSNALSVDHAQWNLPTDHIIEMYDCPSEKVTECVATILQSDFASARRIFHQPSAQPFHPYQLFFRAAVYQGEFWTTVTLLWRNKSTLLHPMMGYWHGRTLAGWLRWRWRYRREIAFENQKASAPAHRDQA